MTIEYVDLKNYLRPLVPKYKTFNLKPLKTSCNIINQLLDNSKPNFISSIVINIKHNAKSINKMNWICKFYKNEFVLEIA